MFNNKRLDTIDILFTYIGFPLFIVITLFLHDFFYTLIPFLLKGGFGFTRGRVDFKGMLEGLPAYIFSIFLISLFAGGLILLIIGVIPKW